MFSWHRIDGYSADSLPVDKMTEVVVAGKKIALLRKNNAIHAFTAACPHAGAPLCEGWLDARGRVVCPLHKYAFDPANGRNTTGEGYKLFTYPVQLREDGIYVGFMGA